MTHQWNIASTLYIRKALMFSADQISAIYKELLSESSLESGRARRRLDFGGPFEIWASVLYPSKNIAIELGPFRQDWLPSDWAARSMKGFKIHVESSESKAGAPFMLLLELQQQTYEEVFSIFSSSLSASTTPDMTVRDAARKCWDTLERWRSFFSNQKESLGRNEQIGLAGELWAIYKLAKNGLDFDYILESWTGSLKTDQDFQFKASALEVKTTTTVESNRIKINSARQLDATGIKRLFLAYISLDERNKGGFTLPSIIDTLRNHASTTSRIRLEELLTQSGYFEKHRPIYESKGYTERSMIFFLVEPGFPRILESDLPSGVLGINYDISLSACEPYRTTIDSVCNWIGEE